MERPSEPTEPPARVLDLFAVPDDVAPIPGGQGRSVRAGDLVLSPDRDPGTAAWLNPVLARLAVGLDEQAGRDPRDLRVAVPVPARDGSWVVDGWGASRFEPGTTLCTDLGVTLAAGRLLHARLASRVPSRPEGLAARTDRWARAEQLVFGPPDALREALAGTGVEALADALDDSPLGPDQLVHADLAGNVLLDPLGAPVVIDVSPAWRPTLWAEAVCVLDSVLSGDAPDRALVEWGAGPRRQAVLRAIAFRALGDERDRAGCGRALALLT